MVKCIDMTGESHGNLTVIERAENDRFGNAKWLCECTCGRFCITWRKNLVIGKTKSCGCLNDFCKRMSRGNPGYDKSGREINNLFVIERDYTQEESSYLCQLGCGCIQSIKSANLNRGKKRCLICT